jgi:hypothetical protein
MPACAAHPRKLAKIERRLFMSVKSLQKQLLAAIAMVVVAAIAMSSATFAWFVNNARVTATDVSVKASTAYSLLISPKGGTAATWGTTASLKKTMTALTPVSTIGEVATSEITLTKAVAADGSTPATAAVGIGDGTTVAIGDVRFVTNTKWEKNYVTGVSEVSKTSKVSEATEDLVSTYFYSETFYLKAAQAGDIYLDSTGIGIAWNNWDTTKNTVSDTTTFFTLAEFMGTAENSTNKVSVPTLPDNATEETKSAAEQYKADLDSARALLKTLRVGLLVTNTTTSNDTHTWHEYQLATGAISSAVYTTKNEDANADGITKAVSAKDSKGNTATASDPQVDDIANASKTMADNKTIADYAIEGSETSMTQVAKDSIADVIASVAANNEVQVDLYVWMEGCDTDTIAANITSFSGTGISGLQLGFCLGEKSGS